MKLPNSILDNIDEYIRWEAFTEGMEKGVEKGREEGMEKGLHVGMEKQAIVAIVNSQYAGKRLCLRAYRQHPRREP